MSSSVDQFEAWLQDSLQLERRVVMKRLSANDTGATGSHQVGPYIPNRLAFLIAPDLDSDRPDPRREVDFRLASHSQRADARLIYYNSRRRGAGTRNECRLTRFGGSASAVQDPANTGSILIVSFEPSGRRAAAWLTTTLEEEQLLEGQLGPVYPGGLLYLGPDESGRSTLLDLAPAVSRCNPTLESLPRAWAGSFPTPMALVAEAARLIPLGSRSVDAVLVDRYDCAYAMFRLVEEALWLPHVTQGFPSIESFLGTAQAVLQRRKARAGRNLEEHLATLFRERGVQFTAQALTEPNIRPDFVFPSIERYRDAPSAAPDLDVLASKSTLRDRWPSVVREAAKVPVKHLFTMDDGVSESQFDEIVRSNIRLVVPERTVTKYPPSVRPRLWTLRAFIGRRLGSQRPLTT
jgi:hypothetical protein